MAKFHPLLVKALDRPTEDSVAVTFDIPHNLQKEFQFIQGQHITLKQTIFGEDVRRSYSICSCPLNGELTVAIKRLQDGKFSTYANEELEVGTQLEVMPPHGSFYVALEATAERQYVAFASGSGITPILSIIETTLRTEPKSNFTLFFGNRKTASIMFHEKLEALKNQFMGRFSIYHILSKESQESALFNGRIDADKVSAYSKIFFDLKAVDHYFTCGPEQMMLSVKDTLTKLGVSEDKIHLELFTSPIGKLGDEQSKPQHEKAKAEITVILDGNRITFPYDSNEPILDVAYNNGADLPYACKGGVCSTCACKLEEGNVEMDVNYALEPDELERGLVLSCRSYPKSENVVLNFDI